MPRWPAKSAPPKLKVAPPPPTPLERIAVEEGFPATPEMLAFQEIAIACVAKGEIHPAAWFASYTAITYQRLPVARFEAWKKQAGFEAWFYDPFTYEESDYDRKVAEAAFRKQLNKGVANGDPKALDLYARIKGKIKKPEAIEPDKTGIGEILESFADDVPDDAVNSWAAARSSSREQ